VYLLTSIWRCPNAPKQHKKNCFQVVLDHFFLKNGPNDMVRGLSLSLDIETYILLTCRPVYLFGSICGYPDGPKQHNNNYFWVILDYFSYKNGPNDLVRGLFSSLDFGTYILPICGPLCTFLAPCPKCPKTA
jgi:hypothetical protein